MIDESGMRHNLAEVAVKVWEHTTRQAEELNNG